jgi:4-amino-4-deoxy-L-arabinose transferase-like glycosyltransferase
MRRWLPVAGGVVLVLAVSAWLRFQRLAEEAVYSSDEITYTGRAVALREGRGAAAADHPPLFWALTAGVMTGVRDPVLAGRIVSAVAGVLGVLGTILFFRAGGGWLAAILAGAALGTLSFHVHWSRLAELDVLFLTWVVFAYAAWLLARRTQRTILFFCAGLLTGIGTSAKFPAAGALVVMGLHALLGARRFRDAFTLRHASVLAGFAVAFAPVAAVMAAAGKSGVAFHATDRYEAGDVDAVSFSLLGSPARAARDLIKVAAGFASNDSAALKLALSVAVVVVLGAVMIRSFPVLRRDEPLALVAIHSAFYFVFFTLFPVKFDYYHLTEAAFLVPAAPVVALGLLRRGRHAGTIALAVAVAAVLGFNAVRATRWPTDGPGAIAFRSVFRFLAARPAASAGPVAVDSGFFAVVQDHRSRGRLDPEAATISVVNQNVNLKNGGPERVLRELRENGAAALVCSHKKAVQPGWDRLEELLRAETRPWARVRDDALPERLPLYLRAR